MATQYPAPADTEPWTWQQVVTAITCAASPLTMPMPAWIRDNDPREPRANLLVLDFATVDDMRPWCRYFNVRQHRADPPVWAWGWHGWTVMLSVLHDEDSGSGDAIETPSSEPVVTQPVPPAAAAALTPDDPSLDAAGKPEPARVIVGRYTSTCSACGGNADPDDPAHVHGGPGDCLRQGSSLADHNGCGVMFVLPPLDPYATSAVAS